MRHTPAPGEEEALRQAVAPLISAFCGAPELYLLAAARLGREPVAGALLRHGYPRGQACKRVPCAEQNAGCDQETPPAGFDFA